jgi:hypothetical protein
VRRGLVSLLVPVVMVTACAGLPPVLRHEDGPEYTVVTDLLAKPGRPIYACYMQALPYPPLDTCGGVVVLGVDIATVAALGGDRPFRGGTRESRPVRLVGTWDGQALTLTQRPVEAKASPAPFVPPSAPLPPPSGEQAAMAEAFQISGDESLRRDGAHVMWAGVGSHGMDVDLALVVADARARQALHRHHYDSVYVAESWLQPVADARR